MRRLLVALTALLAVAMPAAASHAPATPGVFAGTVAEDDANTHHYDNNPTGQPCIAVTQTYVIQLVYAPPTDALALSVDSETVEAENGTASLSVERGVCTAFDVLVEGESVGQVAAYEVSVASSPAPLAPVEPVPGG